MRFNSKYAKLPIVVAYAPTENANDEDKDQFYEALQTTVEGIPKHDVLLLMGDMNARVGSNNKDRERVMGYHGEGDITLTTVNV